MHYPSVQINAFLAASEQASMELTKLHGVERTPNEIRDALVVVFGVEDQIALLDRNLSSTEMIAALHDFSFVKPTLLAEIEFEETIIPDNVPARFTEALVKHRNEIWLVHKYDSDPFPSNPHAHNEANGLKLHLGSGELFRRRECVGKVRRKDLIAIRSKVQGKLPTVMLPILGY